MALAAVCVRSMMQNMRTEHDATRAKKYNRPVQCLSLPVRSMLEGYAFAYNINVVLPR